MCFTRVGSGLTHKIRLGWKGLPATTTLAYYESPYTTAVKSFVGLAPGGSAIKLFTAMINYVSY
jgi:hypothetical protein